MEQEPNLLSLLKSREQCAEILTTQLTHLLISLLILAFLPTPMNLLLEEFLLGFTMNNHHSPYRFIVNLILLNFFTTMILCLQKPKGFVLELLDYLRNQSKKLPSAPLEDKIHIHSHMALQSLANVLKNNPGNVYFKLEFQVE